MNKLEINSNDFNATFEIEKSNFISIVDRNLFLRFYHSIRVCSGIKYEANYEKLNNVKIMLNDQQCNSKNFIVLNFTTPDEIFNNLSMVKGSLLRKIYIKNIVDSIPLDKYEDYIYEWNKLLSINDEIEFIDKDPNLEKIIDLLFELQSKEMPTFIFNEKKVLDIITEISKREGVNIFVFYNSNISIFKYDMLNELENLYLFDFNLKNEVKNILNFDDYVTNFFIEELVDKVEYNFPKEINRNDCRDKIYLHQISIFSHNIINCKFMNDTDLSVCLIIKNILNYEMPTLKGLNVKDCKINDFIFDLLG